jgi:hypothetical protein
LSPRLDVRWQGAIRDLPVRWPSQFVRDRANQSQAIEFSRDDVDTLFGAVLWGYYGVSDNVSDDGQWRVVTIGQFRGPGTTTIELWGPEADGFRGRQRKWNEPGQPRWVKPMGCPGAELTGDGGFVIATGDPDHPEAYSPGDSQDCDSGNLSTYFFDHDGNLVFTWPHDRDRSGMAAAFRARTGVPLVLQRNSAWAEDSRWNVPVGDEPDKPTSVVAYSSDDRRGLVGLYRELRVYSAPERLRGR